MEALRRLWRDNEIWVRPVFGVASIVVAFVAAGPMGALALAVLVGAVAIGVVLRPRVQDRGTRGASPSDANLYSDLLPNMAPAARAARNRLYYYGDGDDRGFVEAIRLFGAVDQVLGSDRVLVTYQPTPYAVHSMYIKSREEALQRLSHQAREAGQSFFNGPSVRMIRMRANPRDDSTVGRERETLEVVLGPIGWYDYEGMNAAFREEMKGAPHPDVEKVLEHWICLSALLDGQDPSKSILSNIVDNAVTFLSIDGQVAYARRGEGVELPGRLTSAVAENINRFKDDVIPPDWTSRVNALSESLPDSAVAPVDYEPKGVPHPFTAALRGIREEASPDLLPRIPKGGLKLTGVSFDLQSFHPDLLYVAALDCPAREVLEICRERPGKDFHEGHLAFVPADFSCPETLSVLNSPDDEWNPGGKASLVRTLEIIRYLERHESLDHDAALDRLRTAM